MSLRKSQKITNSHRFFGRLEGSRRLSPRNVEMEADMLVRDILEQKGKEVYRVPPDATVFDALGIMAAKDVGALPVLEEGCLKGIVSERDYRNKVALHGRTSKDTLVKDIMSEEVIWVSPDDTVDHCMSIMTHQRIRHLPVLDEKHKVLGIVSIGDVVKSKLNEQHEEIVNLKRYIYSDYPG
jgi:CBS domain-containing protein